MGWEVWEMLWGRTVSCYGVRMEMLQGWDGMGDASCLHCSPAVWCCSTGGKLSSSLSCCSCIKASSERLIGALINSE